MTIALAIKVGDGVVLASDSASTLIVRQPDGAIGVGNVYNNANKIFNLRKGLPLGVVIFGAGGIGEHSMGNLIKNLRTLLREAKEGDEYYLDGKKYTVGDVANKVKKYIYDERYKPFYETWEQKPNLGFFVTGYSSDSNFAEIYEIAITDGSCNAPKLLQDQASNGISFGGQPEALLRVMLGFGSVLPQVLKDDLKIPSEQIAPIMQIIQRKLQLNFVQGLMPIQDAINLAEFLVDLTIKFTRYGLGPPTVGGAIEIAAITRHEGFKWIKRKHYFSAELNPEEQK
jgi:hypothetical protein